MENKEIILIKYLDDSIVRLEKIQKGDWIDLRAAETVELKAFEDAKIHLGIAMQLPEGYEALLAPRGSTYKNWKIIQTNSIGVIDECYNGDTDWWAFPALAIKDTKIEKGDRICQFRIIKHQPELGLHEVEELSNSDRGGFGSTGTNLIK